MEFVCEKCGKKAYRRVHETNTLMFYIKSIGENKEYQYKYIRYYHRGGVTHRVDAPVQVKVLEDKGETEDG